jgi:hypothetical protein
MTKHSQTQQLQIQKKIDGKMGAKFLKFIFQIEKELSVEDNKTLMNVNLNGYRIYVLHNMSNHLRFLYATAKKLKVDSIVYGKSLNFYKTNNKLANPETIIYMSKEYTNMGDPIVKLSENPLELKCKSKFPLYTNSLVYTEIFDPNTNDIKIKKIHRKDLHDKRIAYDKEMWFIDELNKIKITNLPIKILRNILNKAIIDDRIKKVLITEFFTLDQYKDEEEMKSQDLMMNNSHSIVLTQGGTGKSSILCMLGNDLHTTTDAGMFGYMDVTAGTWRSGEVSKTKDSIIVDEVNEIIKKNSKKGESVLDILNTPLENGKYSYGKAGGMKLQFGNQFNFLGNISDEFHFENFVNGLSGNQSTMGRRFAYIVYDDKLEFINGEHRDIIKHLNKIKPLKEFLSYVLLWFLKTKKFQDKKVRGNDKIKQLIIKYQEKNKNIIMDMEHPNTKQFFSSFNSHSLENRIPSMALKLTIFKYIDTFRDCTNSNKSFNSIDLRQFWKQFYRELEFLYMDNLKSLEYILSHQNTGMIIDENDNKIYNQLKVLKKSQKTILSFIIGNIKNFEGIKLIDENMDNKQLIGDLKYKVIIKGQTKFLDELQRFGINYFVSTKDKKQSINFTIMNKHKFKETSEVILKNINGFINDLKERTTIKELYNNNDPKEHIGKKEIIKNEPTHKLDDEDNDVFDSIDMGDI